MLRYPNEKEMVLRDETISGYNMDLNNDGEVKNNTNAAVMTHIDRSRNQHNTGGSLIISPIKSFDVYVEYEVYSLNYLSKNRLDKGHFYRTVRRDKLEIGARFKFLSKWQAAIEYDRTDFGAYERSIIISSLKYTFKTKGQATN